MRRDKHTSDRRMQNSCLVVMVRVMVVLVMVLFQPAYTLAQTPSYFSARVPVASQSSDDRKQALKAALAKVLIKVSGDKRAPSASESATALNNASRYLQQFRYAKPTGQELAEGKTLFLKADFDPQLVKQFIKSSGLGLWPENRPQVLIWAIEHTPDVERSIITDPEHPALRALAAQAEERGLPILMPQWDIDDQLMLSSEQLWRFDSNALTDAASRYNATSILAARYSQTSEGKWLASWQFQHAGEVMQYDLSTGIYDELAPAGIDPIVKYLSENYAVHSAAVSGVGEQSEMHIALQGIDTYPKYQAALAYLSKQPLLSNVELIALKRDMLIVSAVLLSDWSQFDNALALDQKMQPANDNIQPSQYTLLGSRELPAQYIWQVRY